MSNEGPQMKVSREQTEKTVFDLLENIVPKDINGIPMMQISCAAAELIPTKSYANVTIGPVVAKIWVPLSFKGFTDEEITNIKLAIRQTQSICEEAVAEDRQSVHALMRQSDQGRYTN